MSPQANPIKRLLLWLAGAPAEPEPAAAAVSLAAEPEPTRSLEPDNPPAVEPELSPPLETAAEPLEPGNSPSAAASGPTPTAANLAPTELQPMTNDPVNDAGAYGVRVVAADLPAGASYWRAVRVHHLTPAENGGRHHLFLDALDEAGGRVIGAQARVTWPGDAQTITVEKPVGEPGANFPLWKWQIVAVEMLGLPSDRVENLHTGHPDEPPGLDNTLFHHSFAVDFQRSVKAVAGSQPGGDKPLARYVLFGPPASSRTARLSRGGARFSAGAAAGHGLPRGGGQPRGPGGHRRRAARHQPGHRGRPAPGRLPGAAHPGHAGAGGCRAATVSPWM
jgi:hypothetical protein